MNRVNFDILPMKAHAPDPTPDAAKPAEKSCVGLFFAALKGAESDTSISKEPAFSSAQEVQDMVKESEKKV